MHGFAQILDDDQLFAVFGGSGVHERRGNPAARVHAADADDPDFSRAVRMDDVAVDVEHAANEAGLVRDRFRVDVGTEHDLIRLLKILLERVRKRAVAGGNDGEGGVEGEIAGGDESACLFVRSVDGADAAGLGDGFHFLHPGIVFRNETLIEEETNEGVDGAAHVELHADGLLVAEGNGEVLKRAAVGLSWRGTPLVVLVQFEKELEDSILLG